jgi:ribA/ribD-fused uncharacterized protein
MTTPVQRGPNTGFNFTLPITNQLGAQRQQTPRDTLRPAQSAQTPGFSLRTIWESIANGFKSLFGCLFNRRSNTISPTTTLTPNAQIARIAARDKFVWFYKQEENPLTAFLGNFHPCSIRLWGMQFRCAEAAFQAAKFSYNRNLMQRFQNLNGEAAWRLGRDLSKNWSLTQVNHWRQNNLPVMRQVVAAKFSQNPDLKNLLLATGNAYLVEHLPVQGRDAFWGDDHNGTGQNWLGRIAMQVRGNLGGGAPVQRNHQYNQFLSRQ